MQSQNFRYQPFPQAPFTPEVPYSGFDKDGKYRPKYPKRGGVAVLLTIALFMYLMRD